jgi:hypothetical protein
MIVFERDLLRALTFRTRVEDGERENTIIPRRARRRRIYFKSTIFLVSITEPFTVIR